MYVRLYSPQTTKNRVTKYNKPLFCLIQLAVVLCKANYDWNAGGAGSTRLWCSPAELMAGTFIGHNRNTAAPGWSRVPPRNPHIYIDTHICFCLCVCVSVCVSAWDREMNYSWFISKEQLWTCKLYIPLCSKYRGRVSKTPTAHLNISSFAPEIQKPGTKAQKMSIFLL